MVSRSTPRPPRELPVSAFLRRVVFTVGGRSYDWTDVMLAAALRGDWTAFETEVRHGVACSRRAAAAGSGPDPNAVESAAAEFRYARDLVTAEEMEAWLEARGLTAEAWMACVERAVLRRAWVDELPAIAAAYPVSDQDVAAALVPEGFSSGAFAGFAHVLAGRVAVRERACARSGSGSNGEVAAAGEADQSPARPAALAARGLPEILAEACRDRWPHLAGLERDFQQHCARLCTDEAIRRAIDTHRLDWIRLDCQVLAFAKEQAAREAALAIRDDGLTPAAVALAARIRVEELALYLGEVEPGLRDHLLGARVGEMVGPLSRNDRFTLLHVRAKVLPQPDDPAVRRRAEAAVVRRHVDMAVTDHVRWHHAL